MMPDSPKPSNSPYAALYDILIPADHEYRRLHDVISFDFVYDELKDTYCHDNGRMAVHPIQMFKYLFLKAYANLSDVDLIRRAKTDLAFKLFLDLAPEADVINPSSLTKFRRLRLRDSGLLDRMIAHTVQIAKANGLLKNDLLIVDATHSQARYGRKSLRQAVNEEATALRHACYVLSPQLKGCFPDKVDEGNIKDLLEYSLSVVHVVETEAPQLMAREHICERVNRLRELVEDGQIELSISRDKDARTGHKSADSSFFGYKHHLAMTAERIITAVVVTSGEAADGKHLPALIAKSHQAGFCFTHIVGDAAYSGKDNLMHAASQGCRIVAPLSPQISSAASNRKEGFDYNKDAGRYVCPAGHMAIRKARTGRKNIGSNQLETHYFNVELCRVCPLQEGCYTPGAQTKTHSHALRSQEHSEQLEYEQTEEYKQFRKERYKIEAKNSELKNRHGLAKNQSSDLIGMTIQSAMTIFVVNSKRIMTLLDGAKD
ncbi:IS1182 family transposase [Exiguobacterium sp. s168]|uniref:IS1182 family transposase n=1 Tax=Exiguobacterium sp. s168 TaxID=2751194 RepID=UPI001BE98E45|nr:IS1182 family transposase [Exiguobacterium sp. s168]